MIRAVIREFGELDHWSDEDIRATVLAVDEACSNIMKHAYKGQTGHTITVKIEAGEETLQVELLDQANRWIRTTSSRESSTRSGREGSACT